MLRGKHARRVVDVGLGAGLCAILLCVYLGDFALHRMGPKKEPVIVEPPDDNASPFKAIIQDEPDDVSAVNAVARFKVEDEPEEWLGKPPAAPPVRVEFKDEPTEFAPGSG